MEHPREDKRRVGVASPEYEISLFVEAHGKIANAHLHTGSTVVMSNWFGGSFFVHFELEING